MSIIVSKLLNITRQQGQRIGIQFADSYNQRLYPRHVSRRVLRQAAVT